MKRKIALTRFAIVAGILIALNVIGNYAYTHLDLTEEKRFTLTSPTRQLLRNLDDVVYVKVLLEGEFPAGFKRLQGAIREILSDFSSQSAFVSYDFEDPVGGAGTNPNEVKQQLAKEGILPVNLRLKNADEVAEKLIYPYVIVNYKGRKLAVNILENDTPGSSPEEILNNSVSLLEYKIANAIQKLQSKERPTLIFLTGKGMLNTSQTIDIAKSLREYYKIGYIALDSVFFIPKEIAGVIVAQPKEPFSEKNKFVLDQYIMNGGKVLWLVDRLSASLDSLQQRTEYVPYDYPTNLEDLFFRYGFRLQPNLVLDLECSRIPLVTGTIGNRPQTDLFPWYYHLAVTSKSSHPIVKSLDRVALRFVGSIDTIKTKNPIRKEVLLASSPYTRIQLTPMRLNFEILRYEPDPTKFNKPSQPLAMLLEGKFTSLYDGRVSSDMQGVLAQLNKTFKAESEPNRMVVVADGDIIKNTFNPIDSSYTPVGFDKFENRTYANKVFLTNALEYMLDANGIIEARSKEVKLRLLDTVKAKQQKHFWQFFNIGLPLAGIALLGWFYTWRRKRRYGQPTAEATA